MDEGPPRLPHVSTHDQNLDLQRDALAAAGCKRVIVDKMSGAASARPGLAQVKDTLRAGDTLVVWRLDRLGRSLRDLIAWVGYLEEHEVGLRSLHEAIDTTTPTGKLTFHVFGALAEFERALIRERTQAGLAAARARGRLGGRRPVLNADKRALAVRLYEEREMPIARICRMMGISKPTLYSYVRAADPGGWRWRRSAADDGWKALSAYFVEKVSRTQVIGSGPGLRPAFGRHQRPERAFQVGLRISVLQTQDTVGRI